MQKASFKKISFLTLCLWRQHCHHNFVLLSKESTLDPVTDTLSKGTHHRSCWHFWFFNFRQPCKNFRSHSRNSLKLTWGHTISTFWCFTNLLGVEVDNFIIRDSGMLGFVRDCIARQLLVVCQMLDHSELILYGLCFLAYMKLLCTVSKWTLSYLNLISILKNERWLYSMA